MARSGSKRFLCKTCQCLAKVDELTAGLTVIECPKCEVAEAWGQESYPTLDHFVDHERMMLVAC